LNALAAFVLAVVGARLPAHPATGAAQTIRLAPAAVLARYGQALALLKRPPTLSFEYSVEQLGLNNLEQTHRVYRSGLNERDETLVVDSYTLQQPAVRILANRTNRYDIAAVAPKPADYAFTFAGVEREASGYAYVFHTTPRATTSFAVSEVEIDGRSFLPSRLLFKIAGGGASGSGELVYARTDVYWVIRSAAVSVRLAGGAIARERIEWSSYRFPPSLPDSTFEAPRALTTALPLVPEAGP
jgi:hypothetical protein